MLLLVATFSLTITSCGGDEDEPNSSSSENSNKGNFHKKANCPYATLPYFVVLNDEIYMTNGFDFAKYQIKNDKWVELNTPKYDNATFANLIIFCNDIYGVLYSFF